MVMIEDYEELMFGHRQKPLKELIGDLQKIADKFGESTEVSLTYSTYSGDSEGWYELVFERPATELEIAGIERQRARDEQKERELYLKLKAKYEA